jgi:ADP-heptose:LPS heptosyltransferase
MVRPAALRRRVNRRFYRCLFRVYRAIFPTSDGGQRSPVAGTSLSRVLIVRPDRIGDLIVTTPVISLLADAAPQAEVDVLASPANAPLLEAERRVHRVYLRRGWSDWILLFPRMRRRRYDIIYSFIYGRGLREGLIASAIGRRETRKISVMRPARYRGLFTSFVRAPHSMCHMADQLLYVVAQTIDSPATRDRRARPMQIPVDSMAEANAGAFLARFGLSDFVAVNIASAEPWREWPWTSCADVLRALLQRWPTMSFVLTPPPLPNRVADAERVIAACASNRVVLFPSSKRFLDLVALVRRAKLVLTSDTANVHVASACQRPVVAIYSGIRTRPGLWSPFGVPAREVRAEAGQPVSAIPAEKIVRACEELYAEIDAAGKRERVTAS